MFSRRLDRIGRARVSAHIDSGEKYRIWSLSVRTTVGPTKSRKIRAHTRAAPKVKPQPAKAKEFSPEGYACLREINTTLVCLCSHNVNLIALREALARVFRAETERKEASAHSPDARTHKIANRLKVILSLLIRQDLSSFCRLFNFNNLRGGRCPVGGAAAKLAVLMRD